MKITPRKYAQALADMMETSSSKIASIKNFLAFLRRKKHFRLLPKVMQAFEKEWNARSGIVKLSVTYPEKFAQSVAELERKVGASLGKKVTVKAKSSPKLIGGFTVQMDDTLIDASVQGRLKSLEQKLPGNA
ncbi:F0F1 ATP synthase subunit delta [Candidatus Peregrinibacteria bacterium]|nr:F0F1 ATP synthase subunit delta [Candidatus Peregrinibacteria bacterium]